MRTLPRLIIPIVTVWLLAFAPFVSAEDFEQNNAEYDIIAEDGELLEDSPDRLVLGTCAETEQAQVCYVDGRDNFLVEDAKKDGYSAVGFWWADVDQDGQGFPSDGHGDPADRYGQCRNPHGYGTWARCDIEFEANDEGRPLHFVAFAADWDGSEGGENGRYSDWREAET